MYLCDFLIVSIPCCWLCLFLLYLYCVLLYSCSSSLSIVDVVVVVVYLSCCVFDSHCCCCIVVVLVLVMQQRHNRYDYFTTVKE